MGGLNNSRPAFEFKTPEVKERKLDSGVAALQVSGELDVGSVGKLEAKIGQALAQGSAPLLIDLTDCGFIDSTVLSLLVRLRGRLGDSARPRFAVVAQDQPLGVLRLTRLDRELPVYPSLGEALGALEVAGATESESSVRQGSP